MTKFDKLLLAEMATDQERRHPSLPDLSSVPSGLRGLAMKAWDVGDIEGVLYKMESHKNMDFLCANISRLRARGLFEMAFVNAYTSINFNMGSLPDWKGLRFLLQLVDRKLLLESGDPLPGNGPFKLYRGVGDGRINAYAHGLSWTASPAVASWFAKYWADRVKNSDPAVFEYEVTAERVYFYTNDRKEQEFVVDIPHQSRPRRLPVLPAPRSQESVKEMPERMERDRATPGVIFDMESHFKDILAYARLNFGCATDSIHGPSHWMNVSDNARLLCPDTGGDLAVVRHFAYLHDLRRVDDGEDLAHGKRSAAWLKRMPSSMLKLDSTQIKLLDYAIRHHVDGTVSDDATIGTCWDCDRLDLGRVNIVPAKKYMSTQSGKELAEVVRSIS